MIAEYFCMKRKTGLERADVGTIGKKAIEVICQHSKGRG